MTLPTSAKALSDLLVASCNHEFDDWSNALIADLWVCRHCGSVKGQAFRIGSTVAEFREYTKKWARTPQA